MDFAVRLYEEIFLNVFLPLAKLLLSSILSVFIILTKKACPTNGEAVLRSKLVDGRCQVRFQVVDLFVRSFHGSLPNSQKYGLKSLRKTSTEGILCIIPNLTSRHLDLNLQSKRHFSFMLVKKICCF